MRSKRVKHALWCQTNNATRRCAYPQLSRPGILQFVYQSKHQLLCTLRVPRGQYYAMLTISPGVKHVETHAHRGSSFCIVPTPHAPFPNLVCIICSAMNPRAVSTATRARMCQAPSLRYDLRNSLRYCTNSIRRKVDTPSTSVR